MELFSDINKLAQRIHDTIFPYGTITKQLLNHGTADKVLTQVAKTINSLNNPAIKAKVRKEELTINIKVSTYGLNRDEKIQYGEKLADLVGHHEGRIRHLSRVIQRWAVVRSLLGLDIS